jgi:hypothetical protein
MGELVFSIGILYAWLRWGVSECEGMAWEGQLDRVHCNYNKGCMFSFGIAKCSRRQHTFAALIGDLIRAVCVMDGINISEPA